jgi:ATP-dependent exoDNAse (exonuclease V) beta subunit
MVPDMLPQRALIEASSPLFSQIRNIPPPLVLFVAANPILFSQIRPNNEKEEERPKEESAEEEEEMKEGGNEEEEEDEEIFVLPSSTAPAILSGGGRNAGRAGSEGRKQARNYHRESNGW